MAICFYNEDVDLPELNYEIIQAWLGEVIFSYSKLPGKISVIFCSDNYILKINRDFLKHDYFTDIITFNYSTKKSISGDLFISLDTVNSNAVFFKSNSELLRVIVHGVLHLLGLDDKLDEEILLMRDSENYWLEKYISIAT